MYISSQKKVSIADQVKLKSGLQSADRLGCSLLSYMVKWVSLVMSADVNATLIFRPCCSSCMHKCIPLLECTYFKFSKKLQTQPPKTMYGNKKCPQFKCTTCFNHDLCPFKVLFTRLDFYALKHKGNKKDIFSATTISFFGN
jgi:hypothetical protein